MHDPGISGSQWTYIARIVAVGIIGFVSPAGYGQGKQMEGGWCGAHGNFTSGYNCPRCSSGTTPTPYQGPNLWNMMRESRAKNAEAARQKILNEAWQENHEGVEFAKKEDWVRAIASYQRAIAKNPNDPVMHKNLAQAESRLANDRGLAAYRQSDWAGAVAFFQLALDKNPYPENHALLLKNLRTAQDAAERRQQDQTAAAAMHQTLQRFTPSLSPAPVATASGLAFGDPARSALALEFGDPRVVDTRPRPAGPPHDTLRDAVADTPDASATTLALDRLENDLRTQLADATDPREQARLKAQLAWTLSQKGETAGAAQAIREASELDPRSPMLKLLSTAGLADTKEKYADTVLAAQALLKAEPGNRVATGILAQAEAQLRHATGTSPSASRGPTAPLVPFAQHTPPRVADVSSMIEEAKDRADKEFVFQGFGKQSHQPRWQEPPVMDRRINLEKYPELQQRLTTREALVKQSQTAKPEQAVEIKKQVENLDKETARQAEEIIRKDFPTATDL